MIGGRKLLLAIIRMLLRRHGSASILLNLIRDIDQSLLERQGLKRIASLPQERPLMFVDVGARGDLHPVARRNLSQLNLVLIEPESKEAANLIHRFAAHPNITVKCCAVGAKFGSSTLYETLKPGNTSTLRFGGVMSELIQRNHPDLTRFSVVGEHRIWLQPLSSICNEIDILKIDTQGTALDVLIGLGLSRPLVIQLEAETTEIYREETTAFAIAEKLRSWGYWMVKNSINHEALAPYSNPEYQMSIQISGDCYFLPDKSVLGQAIIHGRERQFLQACCMFGFQQYAEWLFLNHLDGEQLTQQP